MKTKLGFMWNEYSSGDGYRHGSIDLYPISPFDAAANLADAIERDKQWRINRDTEIIRGAAGRPVVSGADHVSVYWQASRDFDHWYAAKMTLQFGQPFGKPELLALQVRIVKALTALSSDVSPADFARALGAVPIVHVPESDKAGSLNLYDFKVITDWPADDCTVYGPAGKVAAPVESECAA